MCCWQESSAASANTRITTVAIAALGEPAAALAALAAARHVARAPMHISAPTHHAHAPARTLSPSLPLGAQASVEGQKRFAEPTTSGRAGWGAEWRRVAPGGAPRAGGGVRAAGPRGARARAALLFGPPRDRSLLTCVFL